MEILHDSEQFFERYRFLPQSMDGRFVNSDLFKETFPQYAESKESRYLYNTPVHNAAAVLAAEERKPGVDLVYMVTGVPGCGKSTSVLNNGLPPGVHAVYEGQLAKPEVAVEKVRQVLDAGFKPVIVAVNLKPEQALDNTLSRFEKIGRPVSIEAMATIQGGLPEGLKAVHERFGDAVSLHVEDRRDFENPVTLIGWEHLNTLEQEGNHDTIKGRLEQHLERRRPEISEGAWRQAGGIGPIGKRSLGDRTSASEHDQHERSEAAGRGGKAAFLAADEKQQQEQVTEPQMASIVAEINRAMADASRWDDLGAAREANKYASAALQDLADGDLLLAMERLGLAADVEAENAATVGPTFAGSQAQLAALLPA